MLVRRYTRLTNSPETDGFRNASRNGASMRWSIPSSTTPGLNLVNGCALKKSRCFAVTIDDTRSPCSAMSILGLGKENRFGSQRFCSAGAPNPGHSVLTHRGSIFESTSSKNQPTKLLKVKSQTSKDYAF